MFHLARVRLNFIVVASLFFMMSHSDTASALSGEPEIIVLLAPKTEETTFQRIAESIEAHFMGTEIRLEVHWVDEQSIGVQANEQLASKIALEQNALGVLWVDLETDEKVYFYFSTEEGERVLIRRLDGTGSEGSADAVALICKSTVDFVLEERAEEKAPSEPEIKEEPNPPPVIEPVDEEAKKILSLIVDAAYTIQIPSFEAGIQNGGELSIGPLLFGWLRVFFGYTFLQPLEDSNQYLKLELKRHPMHLGIGGRIETERWSFEGDLTLVLDYMTRVPHAIDEQAELQAEYGGWGASLIPAIRADFYVARPFSLFVSLGAEILFEKQRFFFGEDASIFEDLWRIRPIILVGGSFHIH